MTDKKIFSLDRVEGDIAVCVSDDDEVVKMPLASIGDIKTNDVFSARIENDALVDILPMPEERERRLAQNRARMHALAKRSKK